ncbi:MAG: radical SAM protein, partial [Candidatus Woesearchaeota archaeon]|nr:radical SAM protein [Candidatus Woesearchaeota archaeon]
ILMERRTKKKIMNLPGVLSIHNSRRFIPLEPLKRLDELAFPTFLEFDLSKYENKDTIHMITSRGCLYRCNFCFDWTQRKHYSYRTAENILQEIESHLANHRIRKFLFRDLIINGNLENLKKLCDMIIQKKLDIEWTAQGTVDNRIGMEFAMAMKKAGLRIYTMGVESCSDKVLREMNKPYKREHLREFIITLHKAKIFSTMNIIVGHPAEGEQEFMETYNFIKENHNYIPRLSSITTCALIEGTMLTKIRDRYDIVLPKNDLLMNDKSWFKWYTKDLKNTFSVRKKREKKLIDLCNELGIEIENTFNEDLEI